MRLGVIVTTAVLLASCGKPQEAANTATPAAVTDASPSPASSTALKPDSTARPERWSLQPTGQGAVLALLRADKSVVVQLSCPGGDRLLLNIPGFRPIESEERLSFGSASDAATLIADTRGKAQRGGVTGAGKVPGNLAALIGDRLVASYGAQSSGPHPAPPPALSRGFVTVCRKTSAAAVQPDPLPKVAVSACMVQDGKAVQAAPRRAVGTEPFWAARIEGRCVVYSHPEDQKGRRIWTRYAKTPNGEIWTGTLDGQLFELKARAEQGCSDGMSDKRYPLGVELRVRSELRRGCAEAT